MASRNTPVRITAKRARIDTTGILEQELEIEEFASQIGEQPISQILEDQLSQQAMRHIYTGLLLIIYF